MTHKWMTGILLIALTFSAHAKLEITEWMYDGKDGEFVEFTNTGTSAVDMTGWSFDDDKRRPGIFDLSGFGVVAPGTSVILTDADPNDFRAAWELSPEVKIVGNLGKLVGSNLGRNDEINLYDNTGKLVDRLTYGDTAFPGSPRTRDKSCSIPADDYDKTEAQAGWLLSSVGDQYGSWASAAGDIGSPGYVPSVEIPVSGLIVNEYNAVGSEKYLGGAYYQDANDVDLYFQALADGKYPDKLAGILPNGRIQGNGSDWIELVVTRNNLDIRGWELRWAETNKLGAPEANGTDIWFGDGNVDQGVLKFSNDPAWSNMQAGTIITVVEAHTIYVDTVNGNRTYNVPPSQAHAVIDLGTDLSFDPAAGDWWINVSIRQETEKTEPNDRLMVSYHNVLNHAPWDFGVGNDDWEVHIVDAAGNLIWGPVGEHLGTLYWGGSGLSSTEVARLEADPLPTATGALFDDANSSSFGRPNRWGQNVQNFAALRGPYRPDDCYEAIILGYGNIFDTNNDCRIDLLDFVVFAAQWLECFDPEDNACSEPWLD